MAFPEPCQISGQGVILILKSFLYWPDRTITLIALKQP